jgi:hypothetical protein
MAVFTAGLRGESLLELGWSYRRGCESNWILSFSFLSFSLLTLYLSLNSTLSLDHIIIFLMWIE